MTQSRRVNDFYPTPHSIVEALVNNLFFISDQHFSDEQVWEPCCGDGRLSESLRAYFKKDVVVGDIATGQDFFKIQKAPPKVLITNPPFKNIRMFIDHAFAIGVDQMALVCPERLWACKKGHDQWQRHRPSIWANLNWREDYLQKGGSPDRALAIGIWEKPHSDWCSYQVWDKPQEI